jgi:hypothetical protein
MGKKYTGIPGKIEAKLKKRSSEVRRQTPEDLHRPKADAANAKDERV